MIEEKFEEIPKSIKGKPRANQYKKSNLWYFKNSENGFGFFISNILNNSKKKYQNIRVYREKSFVSEKGTKLENCVIFENKKGITGKSFYEAFKSQLNQISNKDNFSLKDIEKILSEIEKIAKSKSNELNEIIGVWGELFLINLLIERTKSESQKCHIINSWESAESRTTIDFNFKNCKVMIEVKTTINETRQHHINSINQVTCENNWEGFLASICLTINESGKSCNDLTENIKLNIGGKLTHDFSSRLKIRGNNLCLDSNFKFLLNNNKELKFFEFDKVPRPIFNEDVTNIKWDVILENNNFLSKKEKEKLIEKIT